MTDDRYPFCRAISRIPSILSPPMASTANSYFLQLLGDFRLTDQQGDRLIGPGKPLALLAYLALSTRRRAPRRALGQLLWPESDDARSQSSLRQALFWIRHRIGAEAVVDESGYLVLAAHIVVDVDELIRSLEARDHHAALTAYRGRLLPNFDVRESDEFMDWLAQQQLTLGRRLTAGITAILGIDRLVSADERLALTAILVEVAPDDDENWLARFQALLACSQFAQLEAEGASLRAARAADGRRLHPDLVATLTKARDREAGAPSRGSLGATLLPFTGRLTELNALTGLLKRALQGEPQVAEVVAPSGYGKSRLLDAFDGIAVSAGAGVIAFRVPITDRHESYSFIAVLAARLMQMPGAAGMSPEWKRLLADVCEGAMQKPGDALHARRLAVALVDVITAVCDEAPLALLLDDVDAIDPASRDVWQRVHRDVRSVALCVVETAAVSGTFGSGYATRVPLDRLTDADLVRVVEALGDPTIPESASTSALAAQVAHEAEGVPRALEQLLALGLEKGVMSHAAGGWRVTSAETIPLLTMASVSQQLYERLNESEREVLTFLVCSETAATESEVTEILGLVPVKVFDALCQLRGLGMASCMDTERWNVAHVGVAAVAAADAACMVRVATQYGEHLSRAASTAEQQQRSVRLLLLGKREDLAQEFAFAWITALEREGTPALVAAQQVFPEEAPAELKRAVLHRVHRATRRTWTARLVLLVVVVCCLVVPWMWLSRPAQIVRVSQSDPASISYGDMPFEVFPTFEIETRAGKVSRARDGDTAWVRSSVTGAVVRGRPWAVIHDGRIIFDSLYPNALSTGGVTHELNVVVTGLPTLVMQKKFDEAETLRLMRSEINGQAFTESPPRIDVGPSTEIVAKLRWRYSDDASTASYFMGYATSWEAPPQNVHLTRALLVGVNNAEFTDSLRLRSPSTPGHYWIVFTMGAESDPKWLFSGTNWACGTPVWGDGNDLPNLPDSVLRQAAIHGRVEIPYNYCDDGSHQRRLRAMPFVALEITVR